MSPFLSWALLMVALVHIVEEFLWPGGFLDWYRRYQPSIASSLTRGFAVVINVALLLACIVVGLLGSTPRGIALWLTLAALLLSNMGFHLVASLSSRTYSPGLMTALVLYGPLCVYGYVRFLRNGNASVGTACAAFVVGSSYPLWSYWNHWRRSKETAHNVPVKRA